MTDTIKLVLIRGLLREARHWGVFTSLLQQHFPDISIITPDIPGNGRLHRLASPATISGMTDALRTQVGTNRHHVLITISMGGMIALDWMSRFPHDVKSAVLINTSVRPVSPFYRRLRWVNYPRIIKMLIRAMMDGSIKIEADILALTSNRHHNDGQLLQTWWDWQKQYPVSAANAWSQLRAAVKFSIAGKPQQPVFIVTSRADRLVDYRCSQKLAQTWQTEYIEHESAGHDLPLDEPEWLIDNIQQWLAANLN